ncbi:MAG: translation initiation factor IF-2 [Pseudarcicella sp.]|nr:translation initiation factor IF-2 [Pseudarcicella sp.]MBP6410356.1 translation initiation factor IF-2 [Pseudarcicella sp.]
MAEDKMMRLSLVAKQIGVGTSTILQYLSAEGQKIENSPNAKLNFEQLQLVAKKFQNTTILDEKPQTKIDIKEDIVATPQKVDDDLPLYFRQNETVEKKTETTITEVITPAPKVEEITPKPIVVEKIVEEKVEEKIEEVKVEVPVIVEPKIELPQQEKVQVEVAPTPIPMVESPKEEVKLEQVETPTIEPAPIEIKKIDLSVFEKSKPNPHANKSNKVGQNQQPKTNNPNKGFNNKADSPKAISIQEQQKLQNQQNQRDLHQSKMVNQAPQTPKVEPEPEVEENVELIEAKGETLRGLKVLGKIELPTITSSRPDKDRNKKKRKRILKPGEKVTENEIKNEKGAPRPQKDGVKPTPTTRPNEGGGQGNFQNRNKPLNPNNKGNNARVDNTKSKEEVSEKQIQDQIKATMARLQGQGAKANFGADKRREKRKTRADREEQRLIQEDFEAKILKVTEFISASELASLMDISINEIISTCMSLGMFVSINQRLEADVIVLIAEEFDFEVQFVSAEEEIEAALVEVEDTEEDLEDRAPIITIMGHVDHGKTSLLDYIRRAKVAAGEAGGITQHIGAYSVKHEGKAITFLDTPGHEAFTAMRARGAKVTDVAIIVIAADDAIMPQTEEAINHALVAGVPIVFAFSKVDKPGANTEKIREQLSIKNILVEEWGGKYQTQEISSKSGQGVNELLEKVLLEAEMLQLKANPNKKAIGTVIEASLDKGRGYVANILVQGGTLQVGDMMLAGAHYGRVKAMFDYKGKKIKEAGPSIPVQVLGLNGAPSAGDKLTIVENERDAREIANKREQILREQSLRSRKHITLEEIGRRKAIGTFKELNVIVKGDVDGSVEALSDSLLKLATEEVQVRIIHKGVGQVSESDVLLASASDAVIVAFQVRPSSNARKLADTEQIEIRTYSIIYQVIDDIKLAMVGMLAPKFEEVVTANIEIRQVFKITKIGTVAGSYVLDGTVKRAHKIRVIRDFVVIHEGEISALKRFKDDVAEVKFGYECGLSLKNFNDLEEGDTIECFEMKEIKRSL